jgi:hypothetical protein
MPQLKRIAHLVSPRRRFAAALHHLAVLIGYGVLSVATTWPLARSAATHVVEAKWHYDSMVNMMILGSRMHYALGMGALHSIYDNYFCAPVPLSIAYNENLFGLTLLYAPFFVATRDPLLAYNLTLLLSLSLSGYFTYLFISRISGNRLAGALIGVAFAYCPYVFFELGRIQLVATQWIPLCALLLHDAIEHGRKRSVVALALVFALQIGSCLYYAVFLLVYFVVIGGWLVLRHKRLNPSFISRVAIAGALVGVLGAVMSYPYFEARKDFPLTRSEAKAAEYSGTMADLARVYPSNRTLTFLHYPAEGPFEPISFPGFVLVGLALAAIVWPVATKYRAAEPGPDRRLVAIGALFGPIAVLTAVGATVTFRDGIAALVSFVGAAMIWRALRKEPLLPPLVLVYSVLVLVTIALFLGPAPLTIGKEPVRGLYFYLYHYVPGFDGVRYVSRLAVLMMLGLGVLGGLGAAALFAKLPSPRARVAVFVGLGALMLLELRNAPMPLVELPSKTHMPPAYKWLAQHPGKEPIAAVPAYPMGFFGAREDYMALFHGRRTINGKSSWMPPITHAFINESRRFPRRTMTTMLRTLGAKYLLLHTAELSKDRAKHALSWLSARPEDYALRFEGGEDYVFEVLPSNDPAIGLLRTPERPKGLVRVDPAQLHARASVNPNQAALALDGSPETMWRTRRQQLPGDWFEVELREPRPLQTLEITDFEEPFDTPLSFRLWAEAPGEGLREVMRRPDLRMYRDQVYHPQGFVFRIVLPQPIWASRIRIELMDTVAGRWWSASEVALWAAE